MPKINIVKNYQPKSFYHVYNRGINKQETFFDEQDYYYFRFCAQKKLQKDSGLKMHAYALIPNHFHYVFYQENATNITRFMRSTIIQYVMYFNKKYNRSGPLFDPNFRAVRIRSLKQLKEIIEYVLSNPENAGLKNWPHVGRTL